MPCPTCGNALAPGARFCSVCGAPIATPPQPPTPASGYAYPPSAYPYNRVARHIQIAGILWLVYAVTRSLSKIAGMFFLKGMFGHSHWGNDWTPFGHFGFFTLWPFIVVSILVGAALSLITGYALLTRQPWGRTFAIVIAILALIHPITGTALGIYTLWVFAPTASGVEYDALALQAQRQQSQP